MNVSLNSSYLTNYGAAQFYVSGKILILFNRYHMRAVRWSSYSHQRNVYTLLFKKALFRFSCSFALQALQHRAVINSLDPKHNFKNF